MFVDMIPQAYPLGCRTESGERYLVLGWLPKEGLPVVVREAWSSRQPVSTPHALEREVRYYLPGQAVSVDGEISINGDVSATVEGTRSNKAVLVEKVVDY